MNFTDPHIEAYAAAYTQAEPELLLALHRETCLKVLQPRMLSGHIQGRLLSMVSHMIQPRTILEIGTYTGYSALCLAEGMLPGGVLHTIDVNEELEPIVSKYIHLSGNENRIRFHCGDALDIIPKLEGTFDLVFIDADKTNYLHYFEQIITRVPVGGIILADNVLWSGKVLNEEELARDPDTSALHTFNKMVTADTRVQNMLLPLRDGLMVMRKVSD